MRKTSILGGFAAGALLAAFASVAERVAPETSEKRAVRIKRAERNQSIAAWNKAVDAKRAEKRRQKLERAMQRRKA